MFVVGLCVLIFLTFILLSIALSCSPLNGFHEIFHYFHKNQPTIQKKRNPQNLYYPPVFRRTTHILQNPNKYNRVNGQSRNLGFSNEPKILELDPWEHVPSELNKFERRSPIFDPSLTSTKNESTSFEGFQYSIPQRKQQTRTTQPSKSDIQKTNPQKTDYQIHKDDTSSSTTHKRKHGTHSNNSSSHHHRTKNNSEVTQSKTDERNPHRKQTEETDTKTRNSRIQRENTTNKVYKPKQDSASEERKPKFDRKLNRNNVKEENKPKFDRKLNSKSSENTKIKSERQKTQNNTQSFSLTTNPFLI